MYTSLFCFSEQHWPECSNTPCFALIKSFPRFLFVSFIAIEFSDWGKSWFPFQSRRLGPSDTCGGTWGRNKLDFQSVSPS